MNSVIIILVIAVLAILIAMIIIVYYRKYSLGSIDIFPDDYNISYGTSLNGEIRLYLYKKANVKKFIMGIRCESLNGSGDKVLYEHIDLLESSKVLEKGEYKYNFYEEIPYKNQKRFGYGQKVKWYLYTELQCSGVNISNKAQLNVI